MSRKLDAAIAEAWGWEWESTVTVPVLRPCDPDSWEVVYRRIEIRYSHTTGFYSARFYKRRGERTIFYVADTIPLAVHTALTGREWSE